MSSKYRLNVTMTDTEREKLDELARVNTRGNRNALIMGLINRAYMLPEQYGLLESIERVEQTVDEQTKPISTMVDIGQYVLATKYPDGDPCDHFFVGWVSGYTWHERYLIVDNNGIEQRGNGFRRAEPITKDEGKQLVALAPLIGDKDGPSLWSHLAKIRGEDLDPT